MTLFKCQMYLARTALIGDTFQIELEFRNLPIILVEKVSLKDYHLTETHHIKGDKINLISTNNCRILSFKSIVPN